MTVDFAKCTGARGRSCPQEADCCCQSCGRDVCSDHTAPLVDGDDVVLCTDCGLSPLGRTR